MARKTKAEAQKTRQLLIEAAIEQFAARGVASTTLTDIADAAGLTRGAVYWHFSSKAEIFNAIWQEQCPLREIIRGLLSQGEEDKPLFILRELFVTALQYIARDRRQRTLLQILYHKCEFEPTLIVFHGFFCGLIKNWLMSPERLDLYQQAPELVDNILSTLPLAPAPHRFYDAAS